MLAPIVSYWDRSVLTEIFENDDGYENALDEAKKLVDRLTGQVEGEDTEAYWADQLSDDDALRCVRNIANALRVRRHISRC